jgi:hypothetical protein
MMRRFANPRSQPIGLTTHDAKDPDPKRFHHWPTGSGFEHFYGFIGGENNQ